MFQNTELKNHIENSPTISIQSSIIGEWNLNIPDNIEKIGNYRYRPTILSPTESNFGIIASTYDPQDALKAYTGATDSDAIIDGGFTDGLDPSEYFYSVDRTQQHKFLFSLEDCFGRFRPRSGINKLVYNSKWDINDVSNNFGTRPRYYAAGREDRFKYWTSYRSEGNISGSTFTNTDFGIAKVSDDGTFYYIDDAAPFVVYKNKIPVNKIVVKMQTNVGSVQNTSYESDPFYSDDSSSLPSIYQTTPIEWSIEYLDESLIWQTAKSFNENVARTIFSNGYVEISYGLVIPEQYKNMFKMAESYSDVSMLPEKSIIGYAYLIKQNPQESGTFYIWTGTQYDSFVPEYNWYVSTEEFSINSASVSKMTDLDYYMDGSNKIYREVTYIKGLRVVAKTMNRLDSSLDLIELSPRLIIDLSDKTSNFSIKKIAADLGSNGLPVGSLLASTGNLNLFDYDQSFAESNSNSVLYGINTKNIQIKFYEIIKDVPNETNQYNFYALPIKTLYADGFPQSNSNTREVSIELRDLFFYLESTVAPQIFIENVSLSYAISLLLDSIGFSNFAFKRLNDKDTDPIIPYFYIAPNTSVAEVLSELARSTQSAMFFDEYNNLIVMGKNYMIPSIADRDTDITLYGSKDYEKSGIKNNERSLYSEGQTNTFHPLTNIADIASQNSEIFNDGKIVYTSRYVQKTVSSLKQTLKLDKEKTFVYQPVLLWEVAETETTKRRNGQATSTPGYSLSAIPLRVDLSDKVPEVVNGKIINNVLEFGEAIEWISRNSGYFYANGEIIKYDAVQYSIPGLSDPNVWIQTPEEYEKYFAKLPFNGKMYPTGRVRIFAEPNYQIINGVTSLKDGPVVKHGRGQFGTAITTHSAGLDSYWKDSKNARSFEMNFSYLLTENNVPGGANSDFGNTDFSNTKVKGKATQNGIIKNYFSEINLSQETVNSLQNPIDGTVQSSAFVLNGPAISSTGKNPLDFVSYVHKPFNNAYTHFGTRLRIVGNLKDDGNIFQSPAGSYLWTTKTDASGKTVSISGSSGGIGIMVNSNTNAGYYFELAALTTNGISKYESDNPINNVFFYKLQSEYDFYFNNGADLSGALNSSGPTETSTGKTWTATSKGRLNIAGVDQVAGNIIHIDHGTVGGKDVSGYWKVTDQGENGEEPAGRYGVLTFMSLKTPAAPVTLWAGNTSVIVDTGSFVGMGRMYDDSTPSVYDLSVEYELFDNNRQIRFYLYINNNLIGIVEDNNVLPNARTNSMALFVRGSSRLMFENVYAISHNYSKNSSYNLDDLPPLNPVFGKKDLSMASVLKKYAISGTMQSTYLSSINTQSVPDYQIYYDEFGTIMREAAYFNIKFDKAYPALYSRIQPTIPETRGYTVSGFIPNAYGAEFLVFNHTDRALVLSSESGNYLKISGIAITQESPNDLTVDDYFNEKTDMNNTSVLAQSGNAKKAYVDIKNSRLTYGKKEFSLEANYIQNYDAANDIMGWIVDKIMKPRKSVGVNIFANPMIQLGDIVEVNYSENNVEIVSVPEGSRFVVYAIDYERSLDGPNMIVYLSEVR